jgi:hypothetical protein
MADYKHIERIESYFSGQLSAEERTQYETDLQSNLQLKKEHDLYLKSQDAIQHLKRTHLRDKVQLYMDQKMPEENKLQKPLNLRHAFLIAASFVFLIFCASFFYANANYCDSCLVDSSSFDVYNSIERGDELIENEKLNRINQFIHSGNYDLAISEINSLDSVLQMQAFVQLAKIKASIQLKDFETAQTQIEILRQSNSIIINELADWQLIQLHLLQNKFPEASNAINYIKSNPSHGYYDRAVILDSQTESFWRNFVL